MLFGARRASGLVQASMIGLVAVGSRLSEFFRLALASWTHNPSAVLLLHGQYHLVSPTKVLFNPALQWLGGLFITLAALLVAFLMMAIVAGQAQRSPVSGSARLVFRTALSVALAAVLVHVVVAAGTVRLAAQYQPAKAAALAGYWDSSASPDL